MQHEFRGVLEEWLKDHRLVVATLEELAGQLATLQPQQQAQRSASQPPRRATAGTGSGSGGDGDERKQLLDRLLQRAPSEQLRAYVEGRAPAGRLQRALPEHLDQNMRLLSILAAEMRVLVQRLEQLADAAAAPAAVQGSSAASDGADAGAAGTAAGSPGDGKAAAAGQDPGRPPAAAHVANAEEALLLAAVADGAAKETLLIANAAAAVTLTTPPEEVSAAATVLQLEPFLSSTLLAAVKEGPAQEGETDQPSS